MTEASRRRFGRDVFMALAAIAWADGKVVGDEADAIVRAALDEGLELDEIKDIERAMASPVSLCRIDIGALTKAERLFVYAVAVWLVRVDGRTTDDEIAALARLGDALDLPPGPRAFAQSVAIDAEAWAESTGAACYDLARLRQVLSDQLDDARAVGAGTAAQPGSTARPGFVGGEAHAATVDLTTYLQTETASRDETIDVSTLFARVARPKIDAFTTVDMTAPALPATLRGATPFEGTMDLTPLRLPSAATPFDGDASTITGSGHARAAPDRGATVDLTPAQHGAVAIRTATPFDADAEDARKAPVVVARSGDVTTDLSSAMHAAAGTTEATPFTDAGSERQVPKVLAPGKASGASAIAPVHGHPDERSSVGSAQGAPDEPSSFGAHFLLAMAGVSTPPKAEKP